jgi:hypothetical protein
MPSNKGNKDDNDLFYNFKDSNKVLFNKQLALSILYASKDIIIKFKGYALIPFNNIKSMHRLVICL